MSVLKAWDASSGRWRAIAVDLLGRVIFSQVAGNLQKLANYVGLTNSNRVEEIDPLSEHYVPSTLADVTDQADATYDYHYDMSGYSKSGVQLDLNCGLGTVTVTMWGSKQDDGTAPAGCDFQDITNDVAGVASLVAAAGAATDVWDDADGITGLYKWIRIRVIANTGGAGAQLGDWTIYHKRLY